VQYSLVDRRPEAGMATWCQEHGVFLLTYGTLLGGLLSETYLGRPEPGRADLNTASLRKYKQMIDVWGGWALFQKLLAALAHIAGKHRVGIPAVAIRCILDRPAVAGVIVGARLGVAEHIAANAGAFEIGLDDEDATALDPVLARGRDLMLAIGDCGDEYRQ
jgi:aryl-alcohol dehydrogenase-like predicted oxidoreductase